MARKKLTSLDSFLKLWNESSSAGEVAAAVGRPVETVRRRASNLRRQGHKLKSMRNDFDVEALSALARNPTAHEKSQEHFVLVWQRSLSLKEVMRHTGLNSNAAVCRARIMRKAGIPLKRFNVWSGGLTVKIPARRLDTDNLTPQHYRRVKP